MRILVKPAFDHDIDKVRSKILLQKPDKKISQIEKPKSIANITGLKLLKPTKYITV